MCMITGMKHGQRLYKVFSNILKYSIIVKGGIQHWGTVHRYHLSWRLWQPNLTECPRNRGKISLPGTHYCGFGADRPLEIPSNDCVDEACRQHDICYKNAVTFYPPNPPFSEERRKCDR